MNKKLSLVLYTSLAGISLVLLVMTILASAGVGGVWSGMPIVIVLSLLGLAIAISLVAFNPRKNVYSIGFYVLHIGIVLFLAGSFVYTVSGTATNAAPPSVSSITPTVEYRMLQSGLSADRIAGMKGYYNQVNKTDGSEVIDLGFNFRVIDMKTEYYEDGQNVKHYEATVEFLNSDGSVDQVSLTVNHPIYRNGWKIYLMSVNVNPVYEYQEVYLLLKKDPTEFLTTAGILLTILGTFMMCFIRPREKASDARSSQKAKSLRSSADKTRPAKAGKGGKAK